MLEIGGIELLPEWPVFLAFAFAGLVTLAVAETAARLRHVAGLARLAR